MTSNNKKFLIVGIIILIIIIAFIVWKKKQIQEEPLSKTLPGSNEAAPVKLDENKKVVSTFPLKIGSVGPKVKALQAWLLKHEGAQIKINGDWDTKTDAAVKKFLKLDNITEAKYNAM